MSETVIKKGQFYVYALFSTDDPATPRYIGKGKGKRKEQHTHNVPKSDARGASAKSKWIRDVWARGEEIRAKIVRVFDDEESAYEYETNLIMLHADTLTNSTGGGGGDRSRVTKAPEADDLPEGVAAPAPVMIRECNPKEEAFAVAYIENGGNATAAYKVGFKPAATTKIESIHSKASEVYRRAHVKHRINQLHAEMKRRTGRTLEGLLDEYDENRREALRTAQLGAANGATAGKAKLLGYDKGDGEGGGETVNNLIVMGDTEVARRIAVLLEKGILNGKP